MNGTQIVLLVLGILVLQVLIWVPLLAWMRKRSGTRVEELKTELANEPIVLGPAPGLYRGASAGFTKVKGNCVLALSHERLIIAMLVGDRIEVPVAEMRGVREDKWFLRATKNRLHVIVGLTGEREIGFIVADHQAWMDALRGLAETRVQGS